MHCPEKKQYLSIAMQVLTARINSDTYTLEAIRDMLDAVWDRAYTNGNHDGFYEAEGRNPK